MSNLVIVNTEELEQYANRLKKVNSRLSAAEWNLDSLYFHASAEDLYWLRRCDNLLNYSTRLKKCETYLRITANDFAKAEKKLASIDVSTYRSAGRAFKETMQDVEYAVGKAVKKKVDRVINTYVKTIEITYDIVGRLIYSYRTKGFVYKAVKVGAAFFKFAKGAAKIAVGVGEILASGGGLTPIAALEIIYGFNDMVSGFGDMYLYYKGEYEYMGEFNWLKEQFEESGKIIGKTFGNEELGERVGKYLYYGTETLSSIIAFDKAITGYQNAANTAKRTKEVVASGFKIQDQYIRKLDTEVVYSLVDSIGAVASIRENIDKVFFPNVINPFVARAGFIGKIKNLHEAISILRS